jgi:hypothetical protein
MKPTFLCALSLIASPVLAQTSNGTLGSGDAQRGDGVYYDAVTLQVDVPSEITVRMESAAFDTYLIVRSPSGQESVNDDYESQSVSQVDVIATETGPWTIWASSYGSGMEGAYALSVARGAELEIETVEGRLDYRDPVALKGEYFDTIERDLPVEGTYIFELLSLGYDGYLVVTSPSGEVWRNDDAGSTRVARVGPVRGTAGRWTIQVTSAVAGEQGAYDLNVVRVKGS